MICIWFMKQMEIQGFFQGIVGLHIGVYSDVAQFQDSHHDHYLNIWNSKTKVLTNATISQFVLINVVFSSQVNMKSWNLFILGCYSRPRHLLRYYFLPGPYHYSGHCSNLYTIVKIEQQQWHTSCWTYFKCWYEIHWYWVCIFNFQIKHCSLASVRQFILHINVSNDTKTLYSSPHKCLKLTPTSAIQVFITLVEQYRLLGVLALNSWERSLLEMA